MAVGPVIHVPVTAGMREDLSPHMAPPGTLKTATNVRFPISGEVESRRGTTALSGATDAGLSYPNIDATPGVMAQCPDGFLVGRDGFGFRYSLAKDRLHVGGSYANAEPLGVFDVMAREENTIGGADAPWPLSQAAVGGYVGTVYSCGNGQGSIGPGDARCVVHFLTEAGALVTTFSPVAAISAAWLVVDGSTTTTMILITQDSTTGLNARIVTTSATGVTVGSAVSVGTLYSAASYWAACNWPGVGWMLVYQTDVDSVTIRRLSGTTSQDSTTQLVTGVVPVSVFCTAANCYVGWRDGASEPYNVNARVYDTNLDATTVSVTLETEATANSIGPPLFGPSLTATRAMYAISRFEPVGAKEDTAWIYTGELRADGTDTSLATVYGAVCASAPFGYGYLWARAGGMGSAGSTNKFFQGRAILLDFMGWRNSGAPSNLLNAYPVVALTGELFAEQTLATIRGDAYQHHLSAPCELSDGSFVMGIPRIVRADSHAGVSMEFALAEWLSFKLSGTRQARALGHGEQVVSGFPTLMHSNTGTRFYDGTNTTALQRDGLDLGFPLAPSIDVPTTSNGAGSLTSGGVYQWRAVCERIDYLGRRWRSAPSPAVTATLGASDDTAALVARLSVNWLRPGGNANANDLHGSRFVVHFYRTEAGGSSFQRVTPPQGAPLPATDGEFTYSDVIADSSLRVREFLYTDGGVLDNNAPPSCRFIASTADRLWLGGLWDDTQIQSSKLLVPGEPPQFSDSPAFRVPLLSKCTGLAVQDGVLIVFTDAAIYAVQGAGPNDQGQGAWESPATITRSTSAIVGSFILETSQGIFFQSVRGIEMLPRGGGEPVFIGAAVQDSLGSATVTSAAVIKSGTSSTARFVLGTTTVLVYDLETGAWSKDSYPAAIAAVCDSENGAVLARSTLSGSYAFLLEEQAVVNDSTGDSPVAVASTLEWADLRPFGIAGQGRFSSAIGLFDELASGSSPGYQSGSATLFVTVDHASDDGKAFDMALLNQPDYRRHVPLQASGTGCVLKLTTAVNGWRFMGWTVEVSPDEGGRRMAETEQG